MSKEPFEDEGIEPNHEEPAGYTPDEMSETIANTLIQDPDGEVRPYLSWVR